MTISTAPLSKDVADLFQTLRVHRGLAETSRRDPVLYDAIVQVSKDHAVYALLDDLNADPTLYKVVAKNPARFLDERAITVPEGVQVIFEATEPDGLSESAAAQQRKFFIGFQDSGGLRWGYEGGSDGRGIVCGR